MTIRRPRFARVSENPLVRLRWMWFFGLLAALTIVLSSLGGCAGSQIALDGNVCGMPMKLVVVDRKDRSAFDGHVTCPGGGSVDITSADSSTSAVIKAMAENIAALTQLVGKLTAAVATPPISYAPPPAMDARGIALERLGYVLEAEGKLGSRL